jgi:hypothetical protein
MSQQVAQALEIATVSLAFAAFIIYLARTQRISFRYTIGWLSLCVITPLASALQLDAFSLVGAIAIIVLLALCVQLSISISGLQRQVQLLNEDLALHKKAVEDSSAAKS